MNISSTANNALATAMPLAAPNTAGANSLLASAPQDNALLPDYNRSTVPTTSGNAQDPPVTSDVTLPLTNRDINTDCKTQVPPGGVCYLKLLVSNLVAGSIIGPKGATVSHISDTTGCTVKLSNASSHFPGTNDRVIVMWGKLRGLQAAFVLIIEKIREGCIANGEAQSATAADSAPRTESRNADATTRIVVKIVVPNSAVSQLIGKQGRAIKELQDTTGTKIQISNRNDEQQLKERIVTIMGPVENVTKAAMHVLESIQNDPHIKDHTKPNYTPTASPLQALRNNPFNCYLPGMPMISSGIDNMNLAGGILSSQLCSGNSAAAGARPLGPGVRPLAPGGDAMTTASVLSQQIASNKCYMPMYSPIGGAPTALHPGNFGTNVSWNAAAPNPNSIMEYTVDIPDSRIGFLIGKHGVTLQNMQQQAGVQIRIAGKGDFVPGTENRRVTIIGSMMGIQFALLLLQQRLQGAVDFSRQRGSDGAMASKPHSVNTCGETLTTNFAGGVASTTSPPSAVNSQNAVFRGGNVMEYQCPGALGVYPNFSIPR